MNKWKRQSRFWTGALSALILGWAAIAFGIWLTSVALSALHPPPSLLPPTAYIVGFGALWMAAFFCIGFAMGFVCAVCWHKVEPLEQQYNRSLSLSLVFFLPVAVFGLGAVCVLIFAFPLFAFGWRRGLVSRARLPHFLGLTNDWERDEKS